MARANRLSEQGGIFHVTHRWRQETELVQKEQEVWVLQESVVPYGAKTGSKDAPSGLN